jgi:hypothetical protein
LWSNSYVRFPVDEVRVVEGVGVPPDVVPHDHAVGVVHVVSEGGGRGRLEVLQLKKDFFILFLQITKLVIEKHTCKNNELIQT